MRIRISIDLNNKLIPVNYREILLGIIYNFFQNDESITKLHDEGIKLENRKFKLFTFSEIYGKSEYISNEKKLKFIGTSCFDITSFDEKLLLDIVKYLDNNTNIFFSNQIVEVMKYDILNDVPCFNNKATYYTVSPITVYKTEKKFTKYFSPEQEEFSELILKNLASKFYLCYGKNLPNIKILDIKNIKKKLIKFKGIMYEAYHLDITFDNLTQEVENVIMTCGLGPKNAIGFGMVSIRR